MLSTITESTELRPLTADEIDCVSGGTTTINVRGKVDGQTFYSNSSSGTFPTTPSNASASWSVITGPGSISESSTVTATNGGSASLILTATST